MGQKLGIPQSIILQWIIILIIYIAALAFKKKLTLVPKGSQAWVEILVEKTQEIVKENMGEEYIGFTPYIGTIALYLLTMNLTGLLGFKPPTADYGTALGLSLISFGTIHFTAVTRGGIGGYLKGYTHPFAFMLPLNIIERVFVPISLSLRLFGNIVAGTILVDLIYKGLGYLSNVIKLKVPLLQLIIPIPFAVYFDMFDGVIQTIIFVMLTMIFIKTTSQY